MRGEVKEKPPLNFLRVYQTWLTPMPAQEDPEASIAQSRILGERSCFDFESPPRCYLPDPGQLTTKASNTVRKWLSCADRLGRAFREFWCKTSEPTTACTCSCYCEPGSWPAFLSQHCRGLQLFSLCPQFLIFNINRWSSCYFFLTRWTHKTLIFICNNLSSTFTTQRSEFLSRDPLLTIEVRALAETGKSLYESKPRKAYQCFSQRWGMNAGMKLKGSTIYKKLCMYNMN